MWDRRDWNELFEIVRHPWRRHRPPRPLSTNGVDRVQPAVGFSLAELTDAGISLEVAERLGLPVDASRIGTYGPNVSALREFARWARRPG